jgi:RecJ-like exonuclease
MNRSDEAYKTRIESELGRAIEKAEVTCTSCGGHGAHQFSDPCESCLGDGVVWEFVFSDCRCVVEKCECEPEDDELLELLEEAVLTEGAMR